MPSLLNIPFSSPPKTFRAEVDTPLGAGFFPVNGVAVDARIPLRPNCIYLLGSLSFSTNADENDFQDGLSAPIGSGDMQLSFLRGKGIAAAFTQTDQINQAKFSFNTYQRDLEFQLFFQTTGQNADPNTAQEILAVRAEGNVNLTPGMVLKGINTLAVYISMLLYQIEDRNFIQQYQNFGVPAGKNAAKLYPAELGRSY